MPTPELYRAPFHSKGYYHIIFRSIDGLYLFKGREDYEFFLHKFSIFFQPVFTCLAYCLLRNHTHFVIRVKTIEALLESITAIPNEVRTVAMKKFIVDPQRDELADLVIERQVNSFEDSYVNTYNRFNSRKGGLFQSPFRRLEIMDDIHLQQALIYTHANAQKHGIVKDFKDYPYSSYHDILGGLSPIVDVNEVIKLFGSRERFVKQHEMQVQYYYSKNWPSSKLEHD